MSEPLCTFSWGDDCRGLYGQQGPTMHLCIGMPAHQLLSGIEAHRCQCGATFDDSRPANACLTCEGYGEVGPLNARRPDGVYCPEWAYTHPNICPDCKGSGTYPTTPESER